MAEAVYPGPINPGDTGHAAYHAAETADIQALLSAPTPEVDPDQAPIDGDVPQWDAASGRLLIRPLTTIPMPGVIVPDGTPAGAVPQWDPALGALVVRSLASAGTLTPLATPALTGTPGSGQVALAWTAVPLAGGYQLTRGGMIVYSGTATGFVDTGLTNGTTYGYTVTAVPAAGDTAHTASAPSARLNMTAGGATPVANRVAWSAVGAYTDSTGRTWSNTNAGTVTARAYFDRSPASGTTDAGLFAREVSGISSYVSPSLPAGTYTVRSFHVEEYWTTAGAHVFSATVNGAAFFSGLDLYASAGTLVAVEKHTTVTLASAGTITVAFTASAGEGELVALEILPGNVGASPLVTSSTSTGSDTGSGGGTTTGGGGSGGTGTTTQAGMARVQRSGNRLLLSGSPYRFVGYNFPWLYGCGAGAGWTATDAQIVAWLRRMRPKYSAVRVMHTNRSADLSRFDWFLSQCKAQGVRVIPVFTDMLGGCGDPDGDYNAHKTWITSGAYNGVFKNWVQDFVYRYKGDPGILFYETINEVDADVGVAATKAFYDAIGGAIHTVDPGALVSTGTHGDWSWGPADYRNVVSSAGIDVAGDHDYNLFRDGQMISPIENARTANDTDKPIYLGEVGPNLDESNGPYSWSFQNSSQYATWLSTRWTATFTAYPTLCGILEWDWGGNKDLWPRENAIHDLIIPGVPSP